MQQQLLLYLTEARLQVAFLKTQLFFQVLEKYIWVAYLLRIRPTVFFNTNPKTQPKTQIVGTWSESFLCIVMSQQWWS